MNIIDFEDWCLRNSADAIKNLDKQTICELTHKAYIDINYGNSNIIPIYHGTGNINFKLNPTLNNKHNDYGSGLYTTPDLDLAKEWALSVYNKSNTGIVIEYLLVKDGLKVLNLLNKDILYWIAILLVNRPVQTQDTRLDLFIEKFKVNITSFDVIIGWRADDSYYAYIRDFINGTISLETLSAAVKLGNLGKQICIRTEKAFSQLHELYRYNCGSEYSNKFLKRDRDARNEYAKMKKIYKPEETYIHDLLK